MGGHRLILIRHAKSDYPFGIADHDRPLNERGRRDAPMLGSWLDEHVTWPDGASTMVMVSTAARAQETWSLASARLSVRWAQCERMDEPRIYEASPRTLRELVGVLPERVDTAVLVGHNPGLIDFVFTTASDGAAYLGATVKFPTSAVAVLNCDATWSAGLTDPRVFSVREFAVPRG